MPPQKRTVARASTPPAQASDKCQDIEAGLERLRLASIVRARELLRVKVLPNLECATLAVPSGNVRNKLTNANVLLLKALEELQA